MAKNQTVQTFSLVIVVWLFMAWAFWGHSNQDQTIDPHDPSIWKQNMDDIDDEEGDVW